MSKCAIPDLNFADLVDAVESFGERFQEGRRREEECSVCVVQ